MIPRFPAVWTRRNTLVFLRNVVSSAAEHRLRCRATTTDASPRRRKKQANAEGSIAREKWLRLFLPTLCGPMLNAIRKAMALRTCLALGST